MWRNEKPGPGRYREFTQFDADTVGSASPSADAELLMMLSDTLEALGLKRGDYIIKLNNRKLLDGVLEASGIALEDRVRRGIVLRAIDKLDRLGVEGVVGAAGRRAARTNPAISPRAPGLTRRSGASHSGLCRARCGG